MSYETDFQRPSNSQTLSDVHHVLDVAETDSPTAPLRHNSGRLCDVPDPTTVDPDVGQQYNPECVECGRESFDPARLKPMEEKAHKIKRIRRIETWRLEQSQYPLEDVRKETKYQSEVP